MIYWTKRNNNSMFLFRRIDSRRLKSGFFYNNKYLSCIIRYGFYVCKIKREGEATVLALQVVETLCKAQTYAHTNMAASHPVSWEENSWIIATKNK